MFKTLWKVVTPLGIASIFVKLLVAPAAACESAARAKYRISFVYVSMTLLNQSYGLGFASKFATVAMHLVNVHMFTWPCHNHELDPWLVCAMGVIVLVFAAAHTAELFLRRSYAGKVQITMQEQQLEERNEQLKAEKERLLYDVQRRGHPLDDNDDRSALRRGLLAGFSQPCLLSEGDTDPSEPGGAPSDSRPTLEVSSATRATSCPPRPASSCGAGSSCGTNSEMSAVLGDRAWTAEVDAMRTAIAENQTARLLAEARADELQAQVELLEEQGLRHRPNASLGANMPRPVNSATSRISEEGLPGSSCGTNSEISAISEISAKQASSLW